MKLIRYKIRRRLFWHLIPTVFIIDKLVLIGNMQCRNNIYSECSVKLCSYKPVKAQSTDDFVHVFFHQCQLNELRVKFVFNDFVMLTINYNFGRYAISHEYLKVFEIPLGLDWSKIQLEILRTSVFCHLLAERKLKECDTLKTTENAFRTSSCVFGTKTLQITRNELLHTRVCTRHKYDNI